MKALFACALLIFAAAGFSQNVKMEGVIQDSKGAPLEMANVMAVNTSTKAIDSYIITDEKGRYALTLKANVSYSVKVSYLGMQPKEIAVSTQTQDIRQNISLETGGIELNGVEIVREMPVSIKGDTIQYNADSFKSGTERKLGDVLKKLPGVEVNADGEVQVEGKKVSKLMVEGKDFFDGDTKLGVQNIPADAIDKVQVLRNYNEISQMKGLENNTEDIAMNIKLKSGKKNFWFGDMTAGVGVADDETRYNVNPKIFYYNPTYSLNVIGDFNNIGELPFTIQDYFKFTGGFRNFMSKGGTSFNVSASDLGLSLLRNNRAREIDTRFGAGNFSYNINKAWSVSGFAIGSSTITDLETKTRTTNLVSPFNPTETTELRDQKTHQKSGLGLFKFSTVYKPNTKLQVNYDALAKMSAQHETGDLTSDVFSSAGDNSQFILTGKDQSPVSVSQNLEAYYTAGDKHVFAFTAQHLHDREDPFYNPNLGIDPFPDSADPNDAETNLGILDQSRYDLNQQRFVLTNKVDAKLDYYYMVTSKSNLNVTLGNTYSYQDFDSYIFQVLDSGAAHDLNGNTKNDVNYKFNDAFLGLHYKFIRGKFTVNPGVSAHLYHTVNDQLAARTGQDFTRLLPDVYALWQIKKASTLQYNFAYTTDFTDINRLAQGYTLTDYNSLFRGNRNLENALLQTHSLRYFNYNMFNFTNIFANISYSRRTDAVKSRTFFEGNNQVSQAVNIDSNFPDENFNASGNYGRSFAKYYKASAGLSLNWSKFNNILSSDLESANQAVNATESFTQNYNVKASTNFKNAPNVELGYSLSVNHYNDTDFYTHTPSVTLDYYFLDAFSLTAEYDFYHYTSNDSRFPVDNTYDFLTASLIYQKKGSKWEYRLSGTNLANTPSLNDDNFSQFRTSSSRYLVQPRYLVFSLKYDI
jgi:hypothetical protein